MILLDVGNSRIKWAHCQAGVWQQHGAVERTAWPDLRETFMQLPTPPRILVSNVAGPAGQQAVRGLCAHWAVVPEYVTAKAQQCGVSNGYEVPQQLGSDRWAALIAAWQRVRGACLVVNCGTATTVDALSGEGRFLGGLILPGVSLMSRCLAQHTAQLTTAAGQCRAFPTNTADALASGALAATAGAIERQFARLTAQTGGARCLISGGAAALVMSQLGGAAEQVDDLVLHGLQQIGEQG
ncbi:MAG: type III pantothenate kinase [Sideroxydans sp.]